MTNREFGKALRELRHETMITQDLVARYAGYEQPQISRMEYGISPVNMQALAGYAKALGDAPVLELVASALKH